MLMTEENEIFLKRILSIPKDVALMDIHNYIKQYLKDNIMNDEIENVEHNLNKTTIMINKMNKLIKAITNKNKI